MAKRITKKDIYNKYGIKMIDNEHIESPIGIVRMPLVDGNDKIGKGVWHFSTLPGTGIFEAVINEKPVTVKGTCPCDCIGCYAKTGNYNYSTTIQALAIRTILARNYIDWLERAIMAQIEADHIKFVRIHASGDFIDKPYIEMWQRIVEACKSAIFWTYTKNKEAEKAFDSFDNANIVKSVIPGKGLNYGHCDYILSCYEFLKAAGKSVYICRCGIDKDQHCNNCKGCSVNEYVLFIEHSTDYKAEKDPLFPVIKALIESQEKPETKIA